MSPIKNELTSLEINGKYEISGRVIDSEGPGYLGVLSLIYSPEINRIEAHWIIEEKFYHSGYGFVNNRDIFINFSYLEDDILCQGIVIYQFETADRLVGKWTEENSVNLGIEYATRIQEEKL